MGSPSSPSGAGDPTGAGNGVALETKTEEVKAAEVAPTIKLEGELAAQFHKVRYRVVRVETGFDVGAQLLLRHFSLVVVWCVRVM